MGEISKIPQSQSTGLSGFGNRVYGSTDSHKKRQQKDHEDEQKPQSDLVELHEEASETPVVHLDHAGISDIIHLDISA